MSQMLRLLECEWHTIPWRLLLTTTAPAQYLNLLCDPERSPLCSRMRFKLTVFQPIHLLWRMRTLSCNPRRRLTLLLAVIAGLPAWQLMPTPPAAILSVLRSPVLISLGDLISATQCAVLLPPQGLYASPKAMLRHGVPSPSADPRSWLDPRVLQLPQRQTRLSSQTILAWFKLLCRQPSISMTRWELVWQFMTQRCARRQLPLGFSTTWRA